MVVCYWRWVKVSLSQIRPTSNLLRRRCDAEGLKMKWREKKVYDGWTWLMRVKLMCRRGCRWERKSFMQLTDEDLLWREMRSSNGTPLLGACSFPTSVVRSVMVREDVSGSERLARPEESELIFLVVLLWCWTSTAEKVETQGWLDARSGFPLSCWFT